MKLKEWFEQNKDKKIEILDDGTIKIKEPEVKGRWKPENFESYWYCWGDGEVDANKWNNGGDERRRFEIGNVFETMEEAEFARERLKIRAEMLDLGGREHFKPNEINNYISYNHDTGKLVLDGGSRFQDLFMIYFDRDISLIGVIEKIGESRLKKYPFGVDDEEDEE